MICLQPWIAGSQPLSSILIFRIFDFFWGREEYPPYVILWFACNRESLVHNIYLQYWYFGFLILFIFGEGSIPLKLNYNLLATLYRWFTTFIFNTDITDSWFFSFFWGRGSILFKLNYDLLSTVNRWFTTFIFNTDIWDS